MKTVIVFILVIAVAAGIFYAFDQGYILAPKSSPGTATTAEKPKPASELKPKPAVASVPKPAVPTPSTTPPAPKPAPEVKSEVDLKIEARYPMPKFEPLEKLLANWTNIPPRALPQKVTLNVPVEMKLISSDGRELGSSTAPAGSEAVPIAFKQGWVQVTTVEGGSSRGSVLMTNTDLKERIEESYQQRVAEAEKRTLASRKVAKQLSGLSTQEGDPKLLEDGWHDPTDPRFKPVRDFLEAKKLATGRLEEAKNWRWMGAQNIDGENFDVVLVHFEVDTEIFGIWPNDMRCCLRNGQVVKWIDADTNDLRS